MNQRSLRDRSNFSGNNKLILGLFGANCSSGRAVTKVPERWSGSWQDNLRLARMADEAGIDFMLPVGRWKGYGGETDYQGSTLETVTLASGLLASTKRITVFGTVHAPLIHPVIAAKEFVTADQIGEGRFGLNVVCGWNEDEFEMFGVEQRNHESRYEYAQEWLDAIKRMWSEEGEFDFNGKFIKLKGVRAKPKPWGGSRPIVMNAGASPTGQAFAVKNCDALFYAARKTSPEEARAHAKSLRDRAAEAGHELNVYTVGVTTCRPTQKQAEDYYRHCMVDNVDWGAVDHIMEMQKLDASKHTPEELRKIRDNYVNGLGGTPLIGDPDHVAKELAGLSEAGFRGIAISFINYAEELPFFCDEVLPRLRKMGLRTALR